MSDELLCWKDFLDINMLCLLRRRYGSGPFLHRCESDYISVTGLPSWHINITAVSVVTIPKSVAARFLSQERVPNNPFVNAFTQAGWIN